VITESLDQNLEQRLTEVMGTRDLHPVERAMIQDAVLGGAASWADLPANVQALVEEAEQRPRQAWDDPMDVPDELPD
jgi:hypothetical protein